MGHTIILINYVRPPIASAGVIDHYGIRDHFSELVYMGPLHGQLGSALLLKHGE
jgi:hypothetical protein